MSFISKFFLSIYMAGHIFKIMDSIPNLPDLTAEFVVAYYTASVYDFRSVIKFYDPEKAQIYRQSLPSGKPTNVNEAKQVLVPNLKGHEKLIIQNYTFNPLPLFPENENGINYFNIVVIGKIVKSEKDNLISQFSQFFTLEILNNERIAIISDSLTITPQNYTHNSNSEANDTSNISPSDILFEIERRPTFLSRQNQQQPPPPPQQQSNLPSETTQKEENNSQRQKPTTNKGNKKKVKNANDSNRFVYTPGSA